MWTCSKCNRRFNRDNQSHYCTTTSIDDLFDGKPDNLLLAFDQVLLQVYEFGKISVGTSVNTIIFINKKTFLIVRPMSKLLDIKFYSDIEYKSNKIHKSGQWGSKYFHHIRIADDTEVDDEVVCLLKNGYDYGMKS